MTERRIAGVLLLLLGLALRPGAAAAGGEPVVQQAPPVVDAFVGPSISLLWSAVGREDGVAVCDGLVLTTGEVSESGPRILLLPLYSLAEAEIEGGITTTGTAITEVALGPVTPNPNHGEGSVAFALPRASQVHLAIFDLQGRQVQVLANGVLEAGPHSVAWQGVRERGARVAGVYFVRLATPERVINRRMVVTY